MDNGLIFPYPRKCANAEASDAKHLTPGSPSGLIRSIVQTRLVVGKLKG
jgi:hypothetical protein